MDEISIYYMRDNHTFRKLSLNVESALVEIQQELDDGFTCGALVCDHKAAPQRIVRCYYRNVDKFKAEVKKWYLALNNNIQYQYEI